MMEPEGGYKNSVIKQCNPIEFGLVGRGLRSTLVLCSLYFVTVSNVVIQCVWRDLNI